MLLTADWVLPVSSPPVRAGAVLVRRSAIIDVGPAEELRQRYRDESEDAFPGCVLTPGLVNAHTRLTLSALDELVSSAPFPGRLGILVDLLRGLDATDLADSASFGAVRSLKEGVTVVGDAGHGPEALAAAGDVGVGGTFFWQLFGIPPAELVEELVETEFPVGRERGNRALCGLSPHSIYASGPGLIRAVAEVARAGERPMMVRVAQSDAEARLAVLGEGPLAPIAERLAYRFVPPRMTPAAYLDHLGVLEGSVVVHCVELTPADVERIARRARGVVLCPTSAAVSQTCAPPAASLRGAGSRMAVGTGTLGAPGAHILGEAREVGKLDPALSPQALLRMVTAEAAHILGVGDRFGSLLPGMQADVVAFDLGPTGDPVDAVIRRGGPECVSAVMAGGVWRVRDHGTTFDEAPYAKAAARVSSKAAASVEYRDGD